MMEEKRVKEDVEEEEIVVVAKDEEEEEEAIVRIQVVKKELINHLRAMEDQEEEDEATIKIQMKEGMTNQELNATIVINLVIILGNVVAQLVMLKRRLIFLLINKKLKSQLCY